MSEEHLLPFELNIPTRILVGKGVSQKVAENTGRFGENVLLVSMQDLYGIAEHIEKGMKEQGCTVKSILLENQEPSCAFIDELTETVRGDGNFDVLVGLGGGTAIDTAKALAISITHEEPVWSYANLSNRPPLPITNDIIPVISIPTTSGTGAEVTPYSVLTNTDLQQKGTIQQLEIVPRVALVDPELMVSMPEKLTASTGLDAFAHALESFINISKHSPVTKIVAAEAIKLIWRNLDTAVTEPDNLEARQEMAWASALAGIAISHRGTTVTHAIAEPFGAITHVSHAESVVLFTPPVIRKTVSSAQDTFAELYDVLYSDSSDTVEKAESIVEEISRFFMKYVNPGHYGRFKNDDSLKEDIVKQVMQVKFRPLKQHPVEFMENEISEIINSVL